MLVAAFFGELSYAHGATEGEPDARIAVESRHTIATLIIRTRKSKAAAQDRELISVLDETLHRYTDLQPRFLDSKEAVTICAGRLPCLARIARTNTRSDASQSRFLIVVTILARSGGPTRMSAVLVDVEAATGLANDAANAEEVAVRAQTGYEDVSDLKAFLTGVVSRHFRGPLEQQSHWMPYGQIDIVGAPAGTRVSVDERPVGAAVAGTTRLEDIEIGKHRITFEHERFEAQTMTVDVRSKSPQKVMVSLVPARSAAFRTTTFWVGAGLVAAGAAFTIVGATQKRGTIVCVDDSVPCGSEGITLSSSSPTDPNPSGVLTVPLGYSLIGAGGTMSLTSLLSDSPSSGWWALGAGVVVGALSYGISALASGKSACKDTPCITP